MSTISPDKVQPGDVIRATKGDTIVQGVATLRQGDPAGRMYLETDGVQAAYVVRWTAALDLASLAANGHTLTLVRRPQPTEPGVYTDVDGDLYILAPSGKAHRLTDDAADDADDDAVTVRTAPVVYDDGLPPYFGPFVQIAKLAAL